MGDFEVHGQRLDSNGTEVGTDDFCISDMGDSDGNRDCDADRPAVAARSTHEVVPVVWQGDDEVLPLVDNEVKILAEAFLPLCSE